MSSSDPKAEAAAWFATLSRLSITGDELREFQAWRREPSNRDAYLEAERLEMRRRGRFMPVENPQGYSVIDSHSGELATFANTRCAGISEEDADAICDVLNRRALRQAIDARA